MANFNPNVWYSLYQDAGVEWPIGSSSVLYGNNGTTGSIFVQPPNTTNPMLQWQIFDIGNKSYTMRTAELGPRAFMQPGLGNASDPALQASNADTVAFMGPNLGDGSQLWSWSPWGDGTFKVTNAANGTAWHLDTLSNAEVVMNSNITSEPVGQKWIYSSVGDINDNRFSTTPAPTSTSITASPATATSIPASVSASTTATSTPASSSIPSAKSGLSTGAEAGIGVAVGVLAVAALVLGLLYMRRRRRNKRRGTLLPTEEQYIQDQPGDNYEMDMKVDQDSGAPHELDDNQVGHPAELGDGAKVVRSELPGDSKVEQAKR